MKPARSHDDYAAIVEEVNYTPPQPLPEDPPLLDAITFHVCSAQVHIDGVCERVDKVMGWTETS
jgi:hypothetical protein